MNNILFKVTNKEGLNIGLTLKGPIYSLQSFSEAFAALQRGIRDYSKSEEPVTLSILIDNRQLLTLNNVETKLQIKEEAKIVK